MGVVGWRDGSCRERGGPRWRMGGGVKQEHWLRNYLRQPGVTTAARDTLLQDSF